METRTRQLLRASEIWQESVAEGIDERLGFARELVDMGIFSNRQIAKIARVATSTLSRYVERSVSGGGRFAPEALTGLVSIREAVVANRPLSFPLIRRIVEEGTSLSNLCRLTGAPRATLYIKIKEN